MSEKKALIVISFGTSYKDTCEKTIGAIEKDFQEAFADRKFYRAWTSGFIRKKIKERDGEEILSPQEALELAAKDGCTDLLIQPTHLLAGEEFGKILSALEEQMKVFDSVHISRPLLETEEDIKEMAGKLAEIFKDIKDDEMAVFMGHGSDSLKLPVYNLFNDVFKAQGHENFCVGTVEFEPGIELVIEKVKERKPKKVYLSPMLVVAGDHANNDMAGDEPDSWKNQISTLGTEVECILKGLGEYPEIREMYLERAKGCFGEINSLSGRTL